MSRKIMFVVLFAIVGCSSEPEQKVEPNKAEMERRTQERNKVIEQGNKTGQ